MAYADADKAMGGEEFLDYLEEIRSEMLGDRELLRHRAGQTKEAVAAAKRRRHLGGDHNHRFEGERYLNCTDKAVRRMQLRKLIDEGGQTTVGGSVPSHPTLERWHSYEFGLTPEEVATIEKADAPPETLILHGWWIGLQRESHWSVAIGSSLVLEGRNRLPEVKASWPRETEEIRHEYEALGIDVDRALALRMQHSPIGVDADHAEFGADVIRRHVNTRELQDRMREAFILRLQMVTGA